MRREAHQIDAERLHIDRNLADGLSSVGMQQHAAVFAEPADLRQRLDGADFVVGQHDGDEDRVVADRRGQALDFDQSGPRIGRMNHRQQRNLESSPRSAASGSSTAGCSVATLMICLPRGGLPFGHAANRQVVALRRPARQDDFFRPRADGRGDSVAGIFDGILGRRAEGMARAARIAVSLREIRQHRLDHPRIDAGRGVIVEIDGQAQANSAFMQICDQDSKPSMSARISRTGRKPHSMISLSRGCTAGC